MDLKYKKEIERELKKFFAQSKRESKSSLEFLDVIDRIEEYILRGGKRIRAILVIVGYLSYKGRDLKEIIKVATSVELLQSFFLIHDDMMDEDDLRRGGLAIHAQYGKKYDQRTSENLALMSGNIGLCLSFEPIINSNFSDSLKMAAIKEFVEITKQTCHGQILDIFGGTKDVDEEYVSRIHVNKTSKYTISGPLRLGAILAGADKKILDSFERFGLSLGRAFQIKDDILGAFGDEKELGKPIGSDFEEGKKTLLVVKAGSSYVDKTIGGVLTEKEICEIRKVIVESGSLKYSENLVKELIEKSKIELDKMDIEKTQKDFLNELSDFIGTRRY